jgi:hypothetical protein
MGNLIIHGTITTVGPLSISMPDGGNYGGFPVMARGIDEDGNLKRTGYLPATTLRGFLRRGWILRSSATLEVFEEGLGGRFVTEAFSGC